MFVLTILGKRTKLKLNKMIIHLMRGVTMKNPLVRVLSWRRIVLMIVGLPLVISLAALAFAGPASRIAPRDLPVGIVGTSTASQKAVESMTHNAPGGFDFHLYPDQASARSAIMKREVYGAFVIAPGRVTVLEATAASMPVAQLLGASGEQLAAHAPKLPQRHVALDAHDKSHASDSRKNVPKAAAKVTVKTVDVVPTSADDPRGVVFTAALLPLTICGILIAALITLSALHLPGWRRVIDLIAVCAVCGLAAYLVTQGILGALPHEHLATYASLSLTLLAISATSGKPDQAHRPSGPGCQRRTHGLRGKSVLRQHLRTRAAAQGGRRHRPMAAPGRRSKPSAQHGLLRRQWIRKPHRRPRPVERARTDVRRLRPSNPHRPGRHHRRGLL